MTTRVLTTIFGALTLVLTSCTAPALKVKEMELNQAALRQTPFSLIGSEARYQIEQGGKDGIQKRNQRFGQYYTFETLRKWNHKSVIHFAYTTELTGATVHRKTLPVTSKKTYWKHLAPSIETQGLITSWSATLKQGETQIHEEKSFMWHK